MKNRPDKERSYFEYAGATYSGFIVSSTDIEPHFHWFLLDDSYLVQHFGDSIAFQELDGKLSPIHHVSKHSELVEKVKLCVERFLRKKEKVTR